MPHKIKIGVIITDNDERVLLIKEKINKNSKPLWNIIKGSYGDYGRESIFEAAIRECEEEAGVKTELVGLLGCYISQQGEEVRVQPTFLGKITGGEPALATEKSQLSRNEHISELRWFTKEEIERLNSEEFISQRIFLIIQDWMKGSNYSLKSIKQIDM